MYVSIVHDIATCTSTFWSTGNPMSALYPAQRRPRCVAGREGRYTRALTAHGRRAGTPTKTASASPRSACRCEAESTWHFGPDQCHDGNCARMRFATTCQTRDDKQRYRYMAPTDADIPYFERNNKAGSPHFHYCYFQGRLRRPSPKSPNPPLLLHNVLVKPSKSTSHPNPLHIPAVPFVPSLGL